MRLMLGLPFRIGLIEKNKENKKTKGKIINSKQIKSDWDLNWHNDGFINI